MDTDYKEAKFSQTSRKIAKAIQQWNKAALGNGGLSPAYSEPG